MMMMMMMMAVMAMMMLMMINDREYIDLLGPARALLNCKPTISMHALHWLPTTTNTIADDTHTNQSTNTNLDTNTYRKIHAKLNQSVLVICAFFCLYHISF